MKSYKYNMTTFDKVFDIAYVVLALAMSVLLMIATWMMLMTPPAKEEPPQQVEIVEEDPPLPPPSVDEWGMTADEFLVVVRVVAAEAVGESHLGQMAVAQCIRETAEVTGKTPYEVVTEKGQYASPADTHTDSVFDAVYAVLYDDLDAVGERIRYFYAPGRVYSEWHETALEFVCEIGGHRFFKVK